MRNRRSLPQRIRDAARAIREQLGELMGLGQQTPPPPEEPEYPGGGGYYEPTPPDYEEPEPPEYYPPEPPEYPEEPEEPEHGEGECFYAIPVYISKHGRIAGRWSIHSDVGSMCIGSVRDLLNVGHHDTHVRLAIHGIPCDPYPGKEGLTDIWLGFSPEFNGVYDELDSPDLLTAEDWVNSWIEGMASIECWEAIYDLEVID